MSLKDKPTEYAAWQFQDAKARLSEVFDHAESDGPQRITRRGRKSMILLGEDEFLRLQQANMSVAEALAGAPEELTFVRDTRPVVPLELD